MSVMGSSKEFILRKYFDELQKFWATQQRLDGEWSVESVVRSDVRLNTWHR